MYIITYMYIYIYVERERERQRDTYQGLHLPGRREVEGGLQLSFGWHYLSDAACLMRPRLCHVFFGVLEENMRQTSNTRQVILGGVPLGRRGGRAPPAAPGSGRPRQTSFGRKSSTNFKLNYFHISKCCSSRPPLVEDKWGEN